jgi:hypothetical protein
MPLQMFLRGHGARVSVRTRNLTLRTALGHWRPCSKGFRYQCTSFFSPQANLLYCASEQGDTFNIHSALRVRRRPKHPAVRAFGNDPTASCRWLPQDAVPVDCGTEPNKLVIPIRIGTLASLPTVPVTCSRWPDYLASLPDWERFLFQHVNLLDKSRLLECLHTSDHLCIASDGGAVACTGYFGSLLATTDTILLECGGLVQGAYPKSFRAGRSLWNACNFMTRTSSTLVLHDTQFQTHVDGLHRQRKPDPSTGSIPSPHLHDTPTHPILRIRRRNANHRRTRLLLTTATPNPRRRTPGYQIPRPASNMGI